ncbi:MAG: alpha/beta fold hydrolase [Acidimicrobiia bacterium]
MATVDANGVRHHYEEHGSGPPVLLLHGGLESSDSWAAQTPALAERHRVVLIDRRGHGRTPDVDGPITYELMRDDTITCIEALDLVGAHLVGWSDGGIIALMLAVERPDLVGRIVTIGANAAADAYTPETRATLGPGSPLVDLMRADYEKLTPDGADHWPVVLDKIQHLWWEAPLDFTDELDRITAPTLVLAGDDDCIEPAHSVEMFRLIRKGRLAIIPGASHGVPLEQPEVVNRMILDFLDGPEHPSELMPLLPSRMEK